MAVFIKYRIVPQSEFGPDGLPVLHDSLESVICALGVVIIPVEAVDLLELLGHILGGHVLRIEEAALNISKCTYVLCHLSFATKPPPTSYTDPLSWQL